jgi:flagellin-like protein
MLFNNQNSDKRGQVGIGTLIVFIAMVLVAAIAAGVLVNTAGFLQETAEQTGQESQAQVSDRLDVLSAYGTYENDGANDNIDSVEFMMKKSAGADAINLEQVSYLYIADGGVQAQGQIVDTDLTDLNGTNPGISVLADNDDRVIFSLDLATDTIQLTPGQEFTIEFVTESGAKTVVRGYVPTTVQTGETVLF